MKQRIGIITVAVLSVLLIGCGNNARNITVEDCTGTSTVTNEAQTTDAYKGQRLESGDKVEVFDESNMTLLLDKDKHIFADSKAVFSIVAEKEDNALKTIIEQSSGAMVFGIDNKLGEDDTYKVDTPNVTMSVRGTVFTVKVDGNATTLEVSEGTVYTETIENGELITDTLTVGESSVFTGRSPEAQNDLNNADFNVDANVPSDTSSNGIDADSSSGEAINTIDVTDGPSIDELPGVLDKGSGDIFGVFANGSEKYIIAPGVHRYQMSTDGLWDQHAEDAPWMIHEYGDGSDPYFGSNFAVSGSSASDYTEREAGVHVMDLGLVVNGDTLTAYRYLEGELSEIKVYTRTGEDPVSAYNAVVSRYNVVNSDDQ